MRIIPNIFTLLNLFLGCVITLLLIEGNLSMESISFIILITLFFDFMDGFIARKFNSESKLGAQLDSLADLISFGLVPGIIMYRLFMEVSLDPFLPLLGFTITLGSAYRLANFNLSHKDLKYFIGLPTPANTVFVLSLMLIAESVNNLFIKDVFLNNNFLIFVTILSCYLLNSRFKLINLKFKNFKFTGINKYRFLLLIASAMLFIWLREVSIPVILVVYYIVSYFALGRKNR
ncbi:MAG TPA: CDP-alcohol phosphatidyltransferase family protein [Flavobacteriaceae bacterium]|nr:CDP-alcohol phosphatidyltransferase family protein [Flavobacteriaceae bacterium]